MSLHQTKFQNTRVASAADAALPPEPVSLATDGRPGAKVGAFDVVDYQEVVLEVKYTTAAGAPVLKLRPMWRNADNDGWRAGDEYTVSVAGTSTVKIPVLGHRCYIRVIAIDAASSVDIRFALSKVNTAT